MKKIPSLLLTGSLLLCLVLCPGLTPAQTAGAAPPTSYLLLISRVQYVGVKLLPEAALITIRPDGTEEFEAVPFPTSTFDAVQRRLGPLRQAEVRRLNALRAEGYTVHQMTTVSGGKDYYETNYLLEKP